MTQFMALPADHEDSFSPAELDFFAEQEPVRIIPRLQTPRMKLLSTSSRQAKLGSLRVNRRVDVPLWLALLLKRQERCNILIPDWLLVEELEKRVDVERGIIAADGRHRSQSRSQDVVLLQQTEVLQVRNADPSSHAIDSSGRLIQYSAEQPDGEHEDDVRQGFSRLPLRWVELSGILLEHFADDFPVHVNVDSGSMGITSTVDLTRRLLRDLRELRQAKAHAGLSLLGDHESGPALRMDHIGALEVNEIRRLFQTTGDVLRQFQDAHAYDPDDHNQGIGEHDHEMKD